MKIYQYDVAGVLVGEAEADPSPLEPGRYLIPARCTALAPPEDIPADKTARWTGVGWELIARPRSASREDAVSKLQAFLTQNPDVAALLE